MENMHTDAKAERVNTFSRSVGGSLDHLIGRCLSLYEESFPSVHHSEGMSNSHGVTPFRGRRSHYNLLHSQLVLLSVVACLRGSILY